MGFLFFINITSKNNKTEKKYYQKIFEEIRGINAIKFISFRRKPVNTLNYASMGQKVCLPHIFINNTLTKIIECENNEKRQAKTKISLGKCQKKVSKPINPLAFL